MMFTMNKVSMTLMVAACSCSLMAAAAGEATAATDKATTPAVAAPAAPAAPAAATVTGSGENAAGVRNSINRYAVSQQQIEANAEKIVREANDLYGEGKYEAAVAKYLEAIKVFRSFETNAFEKRIENCRTLINKCYYYLAEDAVVAAHEKAQVQDYEEAIKLCKQAMEFYPECAPAVKRKIAEFEKRRDATETRVNTNAEKLLPDLVGQEYRIQVLMRQGQELVAAGNLQRAARKYQDVLLIDPYNAEALNNLRSVNVRSTNVAETRYDNEHRKLITELEWRWANQIPAEGENPAENQINAPVKKESEDTAGIDKKIRSITIPRVDFEEVTIPTAIKFLQEESKRNDPEGVGVNIFLRRASSLPAETTAQQQSPDGAPMDPAAAGAAPAAAPVPAPAPAAAPAAGGEGATAAAGGEVDPEANAKKINLIITKKSLFDALRYLCDAAGLKMRVERYAVVIAPENVPLDDLETKIFPVEKSAFGEVNVEDATALKTFFIDRGIRFPIGSQIVYDTRISRLIVTNTIENLRAIDDVIQVILSDKDPMVEISAKFIEVGQNDLKELSFDYTVSYNPNNYPYGNYNPDTGTIPGYSSQRLSFKDSMTGLTRNYNGGADELFVVKGVAGGENAFAYTAKIFAANQMDSSDTLASPRVTTLAGMPAHIEMVKEVPFVDEYDQGTTQQGNSASGDTNSSTQTFTIIGPFPTFQDPTPLGIMMDVTPEVDKVRRTIRVRMAPKVTTFTGWTTFESTDASGNIDLMRKPIIAIRDIDTTVTVYDGETIVLGGVIDDTVVTLNDKIPVLGDLPLVGRMFQSRYSQAAKKNLLIFMTCRLVKPDGSPFYPSERVNRGLPALSRLE